MKSLALFLLMALPGLCANTCFAPGTYRSPDPVAERDFQRGTELFSEKQYAAALPYLKAAAQRNHPRAEQELGQMYLQGWAVPVNNSIAVQYLQRSAAQGHRGSIFTLGEFYEYAQVNLPLADKYLTAAAQCGDLYAQAELGLNYEFGEGVPANRKMAIYWLSQAAPHWGQAHWILDWLKRPDTPHFRNVDELGRYIGTKVGQRMVIGMGHGHFPGGSCMVGYAQNGHCYSTDDPTHTPIR